jgi:MFS family permease
LEINTRMPDDILPEPGSTASGMQETPLSAIESESNSSSLWLSSAYPFFYSCLAVLLSTLSAGLMFIGAKYALKDELHLTPAQFSSCNFIIYFPLYFSFLFGLLRDRWKPFGIADRPYLLVSPVIICACCLSAGALPRSLLSLLALLVTINATWLLSGAAVSGMLAELSKRFRLSGRISVVAIVIPRLLGLGLMPMTGRLAESFGFSAICYVSAALALPMIILAFYRPAPLFPNNDSVRVQAETDSLWREPLGGAVKRLLRSRAAMTAALISLLWAFNPGWGTPLFYYYTNTLRFTDAQYECNSSLLTAASTASALLYAFLCFRFSTRKLLFFGISIGAGGCAGFATVHSFAAAVAIAVIVGLSIGIADAGAGDLLYRASPAGLESVAVLLGSSAGFVAGSAGDYVGSLLYERVGIFVPLCITILVNVLILPLIWLIPRSVFRALEGESLTSGPAAMVP